MAGIGAGEGGGGGGGEGKMEGADLKGLSDSQFARRDGGVTAH